MMFESQFINANVITTNRAGGYSGEGNNISRSTNKTTINTNICCEDRTLYADCQTTRHSVFMTSSGCNNKRSSMSDYQQQQQQQHQGIGSVATTSVLLQQEHQQQQQQLEKPKSSTMHISDQQFPLSFNAKRHKEVIEGLNYERQSWRIRERMKTASVALVLCLNIGVDPPDVVKIQPCSRLECWIDPSSVSAPKAMELIGNNLQMQYERWQPRARYKKCHDPTVEDVKKLCTSLRRNAKGERILFHYNGHGVPKPTANGEIWVFNKTFTQYIPLSIFELQSWMAAPSIYVYDCSNAGIIINSFHQFAEQHERDLEKAISLSGMQRFNAASGGISGAPQAQLPPIVTYKNCIHLAACSAYQILPMNSKLPADLFTCCLTTPINIALRWYTMQEKFELVPQIQNDFIDKIPGKVNDRRTMMGELNWIFTAITDTIAWNTLPRELFQRLFRQDLLVASLFRNFLLAERILRSHDCTPVSHPALPQCFRHPMWSAWDLVVDLALQQLPDILEKGVPYKQLPFFEEQLTAFQVWLDRESESRAPPEQLPIVLQVLLSQVHRLRALELLARFLDLGPWAVNLALGVGIFPYVLKLLQSSAKELRPVLVFIWAKILAVDPSCQVDLVKDYKYFLAVLQDNTISKEHRTLAAFILACIVNNFLLGQTSALQGSLVSICLEQLNDESWLLRQWLAICLGMLWQNFEKARWSGVRDLAHEKLYPLLKDSIPEVRAAAVFALGTFISSVTDRSEEHANNIDRIIAITLLETVGEDMSPLVRLELAAALQWMVLLFETQFVTVYMQEHIGGTTVAVSGSVGDRNVNLNHTLPMGACQIQTSASNQNQFNPHHYHHSTHSLERHVTMRRGLSSGSISNMISPNTTMPFQSLYTKLWQGIYYLGNDPFPKVAETAQKIIAYVRDAALCMITAKEATTAEKCFTLSVSLPPSPNTRINYLGGETSPTAGHQSQQQPASQHQQQQQHSAASAWATKLRNNEPQNLLHRKLRTTSMNDETDSMNQSHTAIIANASMSGGGGCGSGGSVIGDGSASARSSTSDNNFDSKSGHNVLRPIVTTDFIPWTISYFARPGKTRYTTGGHGHEGSENEQLFPIDKNSIELRTRCYRFQRNQQIRKNARRDHERQIPRIDTQIWLRKTQFSPSIVSIMPYEPQMAVAYKEKVIVYDWQKNTTRTYQPAGTTWDGLTSLSSSVGGASKSQLQSSMLSARVNAIEFLNAHDVSLILAGHEDGIIRIWKQDQPHNEECSDKPSLITAWEGLPTASFNGHTNTFNSLGNANATSSSSSALASVVTSSTAVTVKHQRTCSNSSSSSSSSSIYGIVTAWQQSTQNLVVSGGNCRYIRVWDVNAELRLLDIPLGSNDTNVRVLSPFPSNTHTDVIVAGCIDGSVRLYDKRCPTQESRIRVYREHSSTILAACLKENQTSLVTACSQGRVCVIDLRCSGADSILQQWDVSNEITAVAVHQSADLVACGSSHKISIYNSSNGRVNNVLRSSESFMSQKIGHPNCLAFHKLKLSLAVGFVDNAIAIYETPTEFYKLCKRWKQDVDKNPQTYENANKFLEGREIAEALDFIEQKTHINTITAKQAQRIYTVCAFETAWQRRGATSVWCNLFNRTTIRALEFVEDLEYYWNDGYGFNITQKIACPAVADMFDSIDPQSNKANATFYFTHSGTLLKMLVHLGLYRDPEPLTYKDYGKERLWRTSMIDAFATNLAFILYECENEPMVLAMHQERAVHIPGCPEDQELCSLRTLRKIFKPSLDNCNFDATCTI